MRISTIALMLAPLLVACVVSTTHDGNPPPPPPDSQPLTVVVDTGQTMSSVLGGQGVGVFVEYSAGGHWRVRWTCDTTLSGLPCDFALTMTGKSFANAKSSFDPSETRDSMSSPAPDTLSIATHTTVAVDEVDFDAAPGADMKVDLAVSGLRDGRFFFFVQNGQVDGNFPPDKLTDPLIFEASTP